MLCNFSRVAKALVSSGILSIFLVSTAIAELPIRNFTFIHSAWSGSWQWGHVVPVLQGRDYTTITPDLPGHGSDKTAPEDISLSRM